MARVDGRSEEDEVRSGGAGLRRALTAPQVWAGLVALCLLVSVGCLVVAAWLRAAGGSDPLADALVVFAAVFLIATMCASGGFAFSAARWSLTDGQRSVDAHPASSARSAVGASIVVFVTALLGGCVAVSATSDEGFELEPIPASAGLGSEWDQLGDPADPADPDGAERSRPGAPCDARIEAC